MIETRKIVWFCGLVSFIFVSSGVAVSMGIDGLAMSLCKKAAALCLVRFGSMSYVVVFMRKF